jgi:hypothetical protein
VTKREKGADRRARLEAEQRVQKAAQRKRNVLTAVIGITAGVVIIGGTALIIANQESDKPENKAASSFGAAESAAKCTKVLTNDPGQAGEHVGPGTNEPNVTKVTYSTVPPTSGKHFPVPLDGSRHFYSVADAPRVENLVHNLEHGYNVVWYLPSLPQSDVDTLKDIAANIGGKSSTHKFIVAPWNEAYGKFPDDKVVAISHWGTKDGYRQLCGAVSGAVFEKFVAEHPSSDAPEPNTP